MEGLAEAIKVIQETACKAGAAQILAIEDPDNYHVLINGELTRVAKLPKPRQHRVLDIASFCRAVETFGEVTVGVWHSHSRIVAVLHDDTRRDHVTLTLGQSEQFTALNEYASKMLDQRTFCSMLKLRLGVEESFVGQFRRLDWSHTKEASGTAARGSDRMGISISDEVNGVGDLAEELTLEIPVYDLSALPYRYKISCLIEIDAQQQKLAVVPKPDVISVAVDQAQHDIHELLAGDLNGNVDDDNAVPIFYGTP